MERLLLSLTTSMSTKSTPTPGERLQVQTLRSQDRGMLCVKVAMLAESTCSEANSQVRSRARSTTTMTSGGLNRVRVSGLSWKGRVDHLREVDIGKQLDIMRAMHLTQSTTDPVIWVVTG